MLDVPLPHMLLTKKGIQRLGIFHHQIESSRFAQGLRIKRDLKLPGCHGGPAPACL